MAYTKKHRKQKVKINHEYVAWYFEQNPNKTLKEIAERFNTSAAVISVITTKHFKSKQYGQTL